MDRHQIKALRLQLNLTQQEMAKKLYISRIGLSKLERGGNKSISKSVEYFATQLKISSDILKKENEWLESQGLQ